MLKALKKILTATPPDVMVEVQRELVEAERGFLTAMSELEYCIVRSECYAEKIQRLREIARTGDVLSIIEQDDVMVTHSKLH